MLTYSGRLQGILKNHQAVYSFICIGITSSLIFWPLLNSIFCVLLFAYWLIIPAKKFSLNSFTLKRAILFAALYIPVIIGCFYSSDTGEAAFLLQQKSALLIFPIVFGSLPINALLKNKILWTLIFSTTLGCIFGLVQGTDHFLLTGELNGLHGYSLVVLKDMHPSVFGLCCLLSIGFLFEEIRISGSQMEKRVKIGCIALLAFLILFLCLMGNRNNFICLNLIIILYTIRIFQSARQRTIIFAGLISLWLCALVTVPSFNQHWKELVSGSVSNQNLQSEIAFPDSRTARLKIWNSVLQVVKENWLIGVGTGDSQWALERSFAEKNYEFASYNHCNAHNQYLQETVAFGVPGLVIFLLCLAVPFYSYIYSKRHLLYCTFILLFAFVCLSESILQLSKGIIWYSFFNALFSFTTVEK
jgi:O-antigen ligase